MNQLKNMGEKGLGRASLLIEDAKFKFEI